MLNKRAPYHDDDDADAKTQQPLVPDTVTQKLKISTKRSNSLSLILGIICFLQLGFIIILLSKGGQGSCPGDRTDFSAARAALENEYEEREFRGKWVWDEETQFVKRSVNLSTPQFFGDPRVLPEIDYNWEKLMEAEFLALSEDEAKAFPDLTPPTGVSGKYIELDVTHSLHCVNHLRQMLYMSYYNVTSKGHGVQRPGDPENFHLMHMDHCLEQLMETVTCQSDLTPAKVVTFIPGTRKATMAVGQTHTCRKFDSVRSFLYDRANQRPSIGSKGHIYKKKGN